VFCPSRWATALLVVLLLVPALSHGESTPAGNHPVGASVAGNKGNQPAVEARHGATAGPDDGIDELQGGRAKALGDVQQAIAWLISLVPIVLCIVGFLVVIIIIRAYSRRIAAEMAELNFTIARPLDQRHKFD
jgi:hypothetical protein